MSRFVVDIQRACDPTSEPDDEEIASWVSAALNEQLDSETNAELSIRIVDEAEITTLNENFRQKSGPTNVLSFPFETPPGLPVETDTPLLGDIIICTPVVVREAKEQNKAISAHWAHMVIHGTLHLLGFDHQNDEEAETMESLEIHILESLGINNPYQSELETNHH